MCHEVLSMSLWLKNCERQLLEMLCFLWLDSYCTHWWYLKAWEMAAQSNIMKGSPWRTALYCLYNITLKELWMNMSVLTSWIICTETPETSTDKLSPFLHTGLGFVCQTRVWICKWVEVPLSARLTYLVCGQCASSRKPHTFCKTCLSTVKYAFELLRYSNGRLHSLWGAPLQH